MGPADPDALCTRSTAVPADVGGACPMWRSFLDEATGGNVELQGYLQRLFGYALTGITREQHLTFIYGPGGNGKGVFLNVLNGILGSYAQPAEMSMFTARLGEAHTTELAMLAGARLVTASETQAGKRWDEARVKALTGGDPVVARFMRQDNFTYLPQFKLVFAGNHQPELRHVDAAMRRRIHMVPFVTRPSQPDPELGAKLREEWPAILAWAVEGCLAWQREGLNPPAAVRAATDDYFAEEDAIGKWIDEMCEHGAGALTSLAELFDAWRQYANRMGEDVGNNKTLAKALRSRGFDTTKHPTTRATCFSGLTLRPDARAGFGV